MSPSPAPSFQIPLEKLEDDDHTLDAPIPVEWLAQALEGTEARTRGEPGRLRVTLSKTGKQVMVRGQLEAPVELECARSLEPFPLDLKADVFLMLSPAAAPPRRGRGSKAKARAASGAPTATTKQGRGRRQEEEDGLLLSDEDAAQDLYQGDEVVLDPFIREFILLELPLFPLRPGVAPPIAPHPEATSGDDRPIDPRLAPLAAFKARLQGRRDKE